MPHGGAVTVEAVDQPDCPGTLLYRVENVAAGSRATKIEAGNLRGCDAVDGRACKTTGFIKGLRGSGTGRASAAIYVEGHHRQG